MYVSSGNSSLIMVTLFYMMEIYPGKYAGVRLFLVISIGCGLLFVNHKELWNEKTGRKVVPLVSVECVRLFDELFGYNFRWILDKTVNWFRESVNLHDCDENLAKRCPFICQACGQTLIYRGIAGVRVVQIDPLRIEYAKTYNFSETFDHCVNARTNLPKYTSNYRKRNISPLANGSYSYNTIYNSKFVWYNF